MGATAFLSRLRRELDDEGVPRRWPVHDWEPILDACREAKDLDPAAWPDDGDALVARLDRAVRNWRRPDGSAVFEPSDPVSEPSGRSRHPDRGSRAIWTSHLCADRPLAVFRADGPRRRADLLALDQRHREGPCRLDLVGAGVRWIGPTWTSAADPGSRSALKVVCRRIEPAAELLEWTFRTPIGRVQRTVLWFKGRQLALLAEQVEARAAEAEAAPMLRWPIAPGIAAHVQASGRLVELSARSGQGVRAVPLALPSEPIASGLGALSVEEDALCLRQVPSGRRSWLPLLFCWNNARRKRPPRWRRLTVSERSRVCPPEVAFAARITWGGQEHYVFYRSLAKPGLRAFLGHQTEARFLVGRFQRDGTIEPLLKID